MKVIIATGTRGNDIYFGLARFMCEQVRRHNAEIIFGECSWSAERAQGLAIREIYLRDFDYVLFVDADVAPPMDAIDKLVAAQKDIVCAPVWMGYEDDIHVNVHYRDKPERIYRPKTTGVDEVGHASFACLLVSRKVFEAFKTANETLHLWSQMISPNPTGGVPDAFFSHKARILGFHIYVCWDVRGTIHHRPMWLGDDMLRKTLAQVSIP